MIDADAEIRSLEAPSSVVASCSNDLKYSATLASVGGFSGAITPWVLSGTEKSYSLLMNSD